MNVRLGFIGTGWIGRLRMRALLDTNLATFCAVHDCSDAAAQAAAAMNAGISVPASLDDLMAAQLDGIVIATPSALHAEQCISAFAHGKAVFCQKPLARSHAETARVIDAAQSADKLLAVDFSYRYLAGMERARDLISAGELGTIYAADLTFHNAYGPDKPWFYDVTTSGGGCVIDLGIHLVDLAFWLLGDGEVGEVNSQLFYLGKKLQPPYHVVEDYAVAGFTLNDTCLRLCCSWNLHAGCDAAINACFYGTRGSIVLHNVNGSFYDFEIFHLQRTANCQLAGYPDDWGGRALIDWVEHLNCSSAYDPQVEQVLKVAQVIDRIYAR
jgi:predicted dehydrogenase